MTATYITSQVFVCLCYLFLGLTYIIKNRTAILCFSLVALLFNGVHYSLLKAWAGMGVVCIAVIRNILFMIQQKIKALDKYVIDDWIILIFLMIISILTAEKTYVSVFSLFSIAASMIYTISIWQKNVKVYRVLGVVSGLLGIVYFIYIKSIFGVILESVTTVVSMISAVLCFLKTESKIKAEKENKDIAENSAEEI